MSRILLLAALFLSGGCLKQADIPVDQTSPSEVDTVNLDQLALHREDWPKEIHPTQRIKTVVFRDGKKIGDVELQPSTNLKLEEVNGEQLTASIGSMMHTIDSHATDLISLVLALRRARVWQPPPATDKTSFAITPPWQKSSPQTSQIKPDFGKVVESVSSDTVYVRGYYRKDGTYVQPYIRRRKIQ